MPKGYSKARKSKYHRQHNDQRKKGQTMTYKTLHRKLKIEQHEPHKKRWLTAVPGKDSQFLLSFYNIIELSKNKNCGDFFVRFLISSKDVAFFFYFIMTYSLTFRSVQKV